MKRFKERQQKDVYLYIFVFLSHIAVAVAVAVVVVVVVAAAAAALPTKTRPCRTGKHHGPEGRIMELKIGISRCRNVPSEMLVRLTLQKGH